MQTLAEILLYLTRRLYPSGRAWRVPPGSNLEKLHKGLNVSEQEAYEAAIGILDKILPDNDNFTEDDAADWERRLAIISSPLTSLDDRKLAIARKYASPGDIPARQHYLYLQGQLQAAGFNVYVHENRVDVGGGQYETVPANAAISLLYGDNEQYGDDQMYGPDIDDLEKVANFIDSDIDAQFELPSDKRAIFFLGGQNLGEVANVELTRKDELRQLILNIKPAQTVGVLIINYT